MSATQAPACPRGARLALIAAALAALVLLALQLDGAPARAVQQSSMQTLAIDMDSTDNGPRAVASVETCARIQINGIQDFDEDGVDSLDMDIVVPSPGIPPDRGIAAYQFNLFYDPAIVWIGGDDPNRLLDRAAGSTVLPIGDTMPDSDGVYVSWAVDFGPKGIEPAGSSETGPGVIARITLLPQASGASPLVLRDVLIVDNASQTITVDSIESATISVGQPCPDESQTLSPTPTPTPTPTLAPTPTPTTTPASDTPSPASDAPSPAADTPMPSQATPTLTNFSATGGPPPADGGTSSWLIGAGLAALGSAALIIGTTLALPHCRHRQAATFGKGTRSSRGDW